MDKTAKNRAWWAASRSALGLFLLTAGILKWIYAPEDPSFFAHPWMRIAVIQLEVLLGLWLLAGMSGDLAWVSATVFFAAMAAASAYMAAFLRLNSCGCFGAAGKFHPWWAFAIDLSALVLLLLIRPTEQAHFGELRRHILRSSRQVALWTVLILAGSTGLYFVSPASWIAHLRGEPIEPTPAHIELGQGKLGSDREFQLHLVNYTDHAVEVVGATYD